MNYEHFIFYGNWLKSIEMMSAENQIDVIRSIVLYGVKGEVIEGNEDTEPFLMIIRGQIDYNKSKRSVK